MTTKFIRIFKAGKVTSMAGDTLSFARDDVAKMALVYNSETRSAPLVLGHPETDSPSMGTVKSLFEKLGYLYATIGASDELVSLVKEGKYKYVSASFITPTAPNNPAPGAFYLKHIGFLGAMTPAVKGLGALAFSESFCDPRAFENVMSDVLSTPMGAGSQVSFSEYQSTAMTAYRESRAALHQTAMNINERHPSISYVEAVRMFE